MPPYTVISIGFQLVVIEKWPAYKMVSTNRIRLAVIEVACLYSGLYRQVSAGRHREVA